MTEVIQISTMGSFTTDELKKLMQCLRDIEQNDVTRHINVFMNTPRKTVKEMEEIMHTLKPGMDVKVITKDGLYG